MFRHAFAAAVLLAPLSVVALSVIAYAGRAVATEAEAGNDGGEVSLLDRLKTGLRVKAPSDVRFVETVAQRVREGRLPAKVVDSAYLWSVSRGKKYPFPAFQYVIRLHAERLNVSL
jgi:hypothetical protein